MALRLLETIHHPHGPHLTARVYRDSEWEEYRVKIYEDGLHQETRDYHTDDLKDAKSTARTMLLRS